MLRSLLYITSLILGLCTGVAGQELRSETYGPRVRITVSEGSGYRRTGILLFHSADSLAIATSLTDTLWIARYSLEYIEKSSGQHSNAGKGALYGLLGGAIVGFIPGAVSGFDTGDYVATTAVGALCGLAVGAFIGSAVKSESWQPMDLDEFAPLPLVAEQPPAKPALERIRITAPSMHVKKQIGLLDEFRADTLVIHDSASKKLLAIPESAVTHLWVSEGMHQNTGKGVLCGFVAGTVAGGVLALVAASSQDWDCGEMGCEVLLALPALGAGGGLVAGAVIGAFVVTEKWKLVTPAELRGSLGAGRVSDTRIGLRLSLNAF